jgi:hypothetical protein
MYKAGRYNSFDLLFNPPYALNFLIVVLPIYWALYCIGYLFVTGSIPVRRIL